MAKVITVLVTLSLLLAWSVDRCHGSGHCQCVDCKKVTYSEPTASDNYTDVKFNLVKLDPPAWQCPPDWCLYQDEQNDEFCMCSGGSYTYDETCAVADLFHGPPLTKSPPPWLRRNHPVSPSTLYGDTGHPFPTNVWWQNIVLDDGELLNVVNPYMVQTKDDGLHVCLPTFHGEDSGDFYAMAFVSNLIMSSVEGLGPHSVTDYDELSVTVAWSSMVAPIVRGMPYATVKYTGVTPKFQFSGAILSPNGQVSGIRFEVKLNNGQTWILYSSAPLTLTVTGNSLEADTILTGTVRSAGVWETTVPPHCVPGNITILDTYSGKVPTGGRVSATVEGDTATMEFHWEVEGPGELLMMALPHHQQTLANTITTHASRVLKGTMFGYTGETWTFSEPLSPISWSSPRPLPSDMAAVVRASLAADIADTHCCDDNPYFGAKQMAVLARLALIAEELGEEGLAQLARDRVRPVIEAWFAGDNTNKLLYDKTWGGVVSKNGLNDKNADFGNGMYNDHHFHYGYFIYTAAVLAKADPAWGQQWNDEVLHMISDVMEPSDDSDWYPFTRTKDVYDGHAWASGIFKFGDGKNQESTSESVNGWYSIYLYGLATSNTKVRDLGRLLTALEIRATHTYWQMKTGSNIYPAKFAANKAVGILWSSKVDYQTWFGPNVEFIHCIQMLPFTPISEELLPRSWIREEYPVLDEAYSRADPLLSEGWKGYIIMAHAIIDREAAWTEALELTSYDDGNTRSNTLYWIASRPDNDGVTYPPLTEGPTVCGTDDPATTEEPTDPATDPSTDSPTDPPATQPPNSCAGCHPGETGGTIIDLLCGDCGNDPNKCIGCNACGVDNCRFCGFGDYVNVTCEVPTEELGYGFLYYRGL